MRGVKRGFCLSWLAVAVALGACGDDLPPAAGSSSTGGSSTGGSDGSGTADETAGDTEAPPELDVHGFADGCYRVATSEAWLSPNGGGDAFSFADSEGGAARFTMRAADLGTYLLYDQDGGYVVSDDGPLLRQTTLESDVTQIDDAYVSGAQWALETSTNDPTRYQLRNLRNDQLMGTDGLVATETDAVAVSFEEATDCREHPELSLDASGEVMQTHFDDGDLYGIVDTHSHILSNFAFGGGGIFHGGAFHPLGVEHALPDCELYHGENGRRDFFGYAFDTAGADGLDLAGVLPDLLAGELSVDNHLTAGYPDFTEWPHAPSRSTHQTQYYRWLERAYLSGLRLVVQHATTNSVICHLTAGEGVQDVRYSCDDMVAVDRIIEETYAMERYIDAQSGGPGEGWFRIVFTPQEARQVVGEGKMAVILGIETSDLFDCTVVHREGNATCDEAYIDQQLDAYYDLGIRALFPVHKYDNAFSPGDGDRAFIELGNFFNSGHFSNFVLDGCPDIPITFDQGNVAFGGLNMPRDEYISEPPNDFSNFPNQPLVTAFPFLSALDGAPLEGNYCQNGTLTPLGEHLLNGMMDRGMIVEIDHLPRHSRQRAFEMLTEASYPPVSTHGQNSDGQVYALGGVSKLGLGRCRGETPGSTLDGLANRVALIEANGGYPAEGFGFDLNGFAGARGPRFGDGVCGTPQEDPITYPFNSYAGDVEFTEPAIGNRTLDFNTEGLVHIGLLPELLEDARNDAVSDEDLEPLFRSAEGYIRMWELAEQRASER